MKKTISVLLALALLLVPAIPTAAEGAVIDPTVTRSITEADAAVGNGLAFRFILHAAGVQVNGRNEFVNDTATVLHDGAAVKLVRMGAVVTNDTAVGADAAQMVLDNTGPNTRTVDVEGKILCEVDTDYCAFAVRIIKIPEVGQTTAIYARPYYVIDADGTQQVIYGDIQCRSYRQQWCVNNTELPAIGSDIDMEKKKDRIRVEDAYRVGDEVTLTFRNYTTNWITEETNWVQVTCYNVDGNALESITIYIGSIDTKKNKEKSFTFAVPADTAKVALTSSKIVYWTEWA